MLMLAGSMVVSAGLAAPTFERASSNPLLDDATFGDKQDWTDFSSIGTSADSIDSISVTKKTALGFAPFWRAIYLISSDMGSMPIWINKRVSTEFGEGKQRDRKHPANIINKKPNKYMTRYTFIQTIMSHAVYRGNGYAFIVRDGGGRPKELLILDPTCTWPVRRNGVLWYVTQVNGKLLKLDYEDVIHIKGLGDDGLQGFDLLTYAKKTLGLAMATREHRIMFFKQGAQASVVLECPGRMPPKVLKRLTTQWRELYSGVSRHHRTAILQMGTSAKVLSQTARDSQLLEGQEFDVMQISAITGVPPHKIGGRGRQSWGSMEQENEAYMSDCISHWITACEMEFADKLLTEKEKDADSHTIEFLTQAKVKANLLTRYQAYGVGILNRWLVPNDVRRSEGMNPLPWGDEPVDFQKSGGSPGAGGSQSGSLTEQDVIDIVQKIVAGTQP